MIKTDTLTVSRVVRILNEHGISDIPDSENVMMSSIVINSIDNKIVNDILDILGVEISSDKINNVETIATFFQMINNQIAQYNNEIEKRKKHATEVLKCWREDELAPLDEKVYHCDYYLSCYKTLAEAGINPEKLNIYESFILAEDIACQEIKSNVYQMLGMLEDKNKTYCLIQKENLKHANFVAFVLDIYNDTEKLYNEMIEKERNKK